MSNDKKYFVNIFVLTFFIYLKQISYGKPKYLMDELIKKKNLPEKFRDFKVDQFLTFDIEVVQKNGSEEQLLTPISIGVGSTFDKDQYFERKSSLPKDGDLLVTEFMNYLEQAYYIYRSK